MRYRAQCICKWRDLYGYFNTAAAEAAGYRHFKRMNFDKSQHRTTVVMLK